MERRTRMNEKPKYNNFPADKLWGKMDAVERTLKDYRRAKDDLADARLSYVISEITDTKDWELYRYDAESRTVIVKRIFESPHAALLCFTHNLGKISFRVRVYPEIKAFEVTLKGNITDVVQYCAREICIKIKASKYYSYKDDMGLFYAILPGNNLESLKR
jgi:hypothetical protein